MSASASQPRDDGPGAALQPLPGAGSSEGVAWRSLSRLSSP